MRNIFSLLLLASSLTMSAQQQQDPVIMTIDGSPVLRSEFEYSFNKNRAEGVEVAPQAVADYVPLFVNYKLKVAAAERAHLDTLSSYKKEFYTYRDMQLTPYMVDSTYIDSVAHSIYDRTAMQLQGKDMVLPSHILFYLPQKSSDSEREAARQKADSVYALLLAGADFKAMAEKYSQDPGSARKGGEIGWIGPGSTVAEFERTAYSLKKGEMSKPFLSPVGYHIMKMTDRKSLEPYSKLRSEIVEALKKQGIESASAEHKINKIVASSGGKKTRKMVLDSVLKANLNNMQLRYLVQEYHDGLLLYELSKRRVWDPAERDTLGLELTFKKNKKSYKWDAPKFNGFIIHAKTKGDLKRARKVLKKSDYSNWKERVREHLNKDSVCVVVSGPYLVKEGGNRYVDMFCFKGEKVKGRKKYPITGYYGKVLKGPKNYKQVKSEVLTDLQQRMMNEWVKELRQGADIKVDESVLQTVNKH